MNLSLIPLSPTLAISSLADDPRLLEAKGLLTAALQDHQRKLTGVKPPREELKIPYKELLEHYAAVRGGNLWYPCVTSGMGNGALVELCDGSVKYDLICGIGVHYMGHNSPLLLQAGLEAALVDTTMQGHLQGSGAAYALSGKLLAAAEMPSGHCFLSSSGAMAMENGLKVAFHAKPATSRVLAFENCFAGRTLVTAQITDRPGYRVGLPEVLPVDHVPFYNSADPEGSLNRAVSALKMHLNRHPGKHAVMIFELVQGEGGFHVGEKNFFRALMQLCHEHGVLVLADEIQTFARTTSLFAYQHFELQDLVDIVTIGKVLQACATLFRAELKPKPGLLAQTFTSSTSGIHAGYAILTEILENGYLGPNGKIATMAAHFNERISSMQKRHPDTIKGPYGIGSMIAFSPYGGVQEKVTDYTHRLFHNGVIAFQTGSFPARVRFLPPVGGIHPVDIDRAMDIVEKTL